MTDDRQSRLLMQYVEALKHDPNSPPPHGLDAETAAFARKLMHRRTDRRERIWQNVLNDLDSNQTGGHPMQAIYTPKQTAPTINFRIPLTLVAAMLALIVAGVILASMNGDPEEPTPFAAQIAVDEDDIDAEQEVVTATATATPTQTFTPTWTITASATFTPTPMSEGGATLVPTSTPIPTLPDTTTSPIQPTALRPTVVPSGNIQERMTQVVIALQDIPYGTQIEADMLTTALYPDDAVVAGITSNEADLIGRYVTQDVLRWQPIRTTTLSDPNENCLIPANYSYPLDIERGNQLELVNIDEPEVGLRVSLWVRVTVDEMDETIITRLIEDAILFCIQPETLTFGVASNEDRTQAILLRDAGAQIIVAPRFTAMDEINVE